MSTLTLIYVYFFNIFLLNPLSYCYYTKHKLFCHYFPHTCTESIQRSADGHVIDPMCMIWQHLQTNHVLFMLLKQHNITIINIIKSRLGQPETKWHSKLHIKSAKILIKQLLKAATIDLCLCQPYILTV